MSRTTRRRSWLLIAALVLLALVILIGIFGNLLPGDPTTQNLLARMKPPGTAGHPLGTDDLGRDVLARLIAGTRLSIFISLTAATLSAVIGSVIGLISGYLGRWPDVIIMRVVDIWLAFPGLLLALVLVAVFGPGVDKIILALVLAGWPGYARLVRGEVLSLREREFVLSAKGLGASRASIIFRHLVPNILPPVIVVATLDLGVVIVTQASLSFLGLGLDQATQPSWGGMLASGRTYIAIAWWLSTIPGLVILTVVLAVNIVGDALRDWSDPRTRVTSGAGGAGQPSVLSARRIFGRLVGARAQDYRTDRPDRPDRPDRASAGQELASLKQERVS